MSRTINIILAFETTMWQSDAILGFKKRVYGHSVKLGGKGAIKQGTTMSCK